MLLQCTQPTRCSPPQLIHTPHFIYTPSINSPKLYFNLSFRNSISIYLSQTLFQSLRHHIGRIILYICIKESITLLFLTFNDSNEWGEIPSLYTNQKHIQLFFFPQIIPNVCTNLSTPVIPEVLPRTKDRQTFKIPIIIHENQEESNIFLSLSTVLLTGFGMLCHM